MTAPAGFTQASVKRAIEAARKAGLKIVAIQADGTVVVADADALPHTIKAYIERDKWQVRE